MLKINLLPVKKRRRPKAAVPTIPILPMAIVSAVSAIVAGYFWFSLENKISTLEADKATKEKTLADLKSKIKEVENFEKDNKSFEEKVNIIERLRRAQSSPVLLLDEISSSIPERVWLSSMSESGGAIYIEGLAFSNTDIVSFVNNLKASKYLTEVELKESKHIEKEKVPVFEFKLTCRINV